MSSDRSKKILKNALVPRRLMFDIEPDSDAVQDLDLINSNNNSYKPLSPTVNIITNPTQENIISNPTQENDSDVIEDSDTERTYAIPQRVEMSTHIQQIEQFDEGITNLETEIENIEILHENNSGNVNFDEGITNLETEIENIEILHENNSGNVNNVGSALKVRSKRIIKKSYADYLSDNGDFEWSSSSWVGSSDDECSDEETSRKKQKTDALEDGKVGNNGYKKKKKTNTKKERKQLRNEGKEYTKKDGTVARAKVMKSHPCLSKKCGRSCHEISDERRQSLFDYFHGLSKERKRDWLVSNSQIEDTKRKRTKDACSRRQYSFLYFINEGEGRRQICQKFLISTLDITQRYVYYTLTNAQYKLSKTDMRGKHVPPNKTSAQTKESVMTYITNLPAVPSHYYYYCRKDSTRLYLPQEFKNLSNLYQLYKTDFSSKGKYYVGEKVFRNIFTENFNISFHVPKKDKCLKCTSFKNNPDGFTVEEKTAHEKEVEDSKNRFKYHQEIRKQDSQTLCVSFDLQKVLNTPYGESMLFYYSRKYSVYNFTLYESVTREVYCYSWVEADGKRGGNEIATILNNYIKIVDQRQTVRHLLLYSDSCCGQNRNKIVFAAVHTSLQSCQFIETIQMNFLIPGHTSMPVDSVHAVIERSIQGSIIYAPSQWATIFQLARKNPKPYNVEIMCHDDFKSWDSMSEKYFKNNLVGKISKMRIVTFKKNDLANIFVKFSMSDTAVSEKIEVLGKNKGPGHDLYKNRLPIPKQKHADLVKLCKTFAIPRRYHEEYLSLQACNARDMLPDTDVEDVDN